MIRRRHWTLAAVTALGLHAVGFSVLAQRSDQGASLPDQQGVDVELGLLGEVAGTPQLTEEENEPQAVVAPPAKPEPEPEPELKQEPVPALVPERASTPAPEPEPVQKAEVQIKRESKPEPRPVLEPKLVPKPEPEPKTILKHVPEPESKPKPVAKVVSTVASNKPVDVNASAAHANNVAGEASRPGGISSADQSAAAAAAAGARASWYAKVASHLARHKHYPMRARRMRHEAVVTLSFVVARDGSVRQAKITGPSKYRALNTAVEDMLKRATPLPAFPEDLPEDELNLLIPVVFKLQ